MSAQPTDKKTQTKKIFILSRIGRRPVEIPDGVKATINGSDVQVEGKRGKLAWRLPRLITGRVEGKNIVIEPTMKNSETKALHGLSRKIVSNMVEGVTKGFQKKLVIDGVGFRAQLAGQKLTMSLGYSHPAVYDAPKEVKIVIEGKGQNQLLIEGNDKQLVGQVAAEIRAIKKPEPYKGTGIRYENEVIRRKAGKAAVGAGGKK